MAHLQTLLELKTLSAIFCPCIGMAINFTYAFEPLKTLVRCSILQRLFTLVTKGSKFYISLKAFETLVRVSILKRRLHL